MADNLTAPGAGASLATKQLPDNSHAGKVHPVAADGTVIPFATTAKQDAMQAAILSTASATHWATVTPSDSTVLTNVKGLRVGGAGNLVLKGSDDVVVTIAVADKEVLPVSPKSVMAATTATGIVALY